MNSSESDRQRLAIDGGDPVRRSMLPYGRQSITDEDIAAVVDVLRSDWLTTGPRVDEFETQFARAVGAAHAVACSSGTAALHAAVFAAGIGAGDEVITTPLTFCATANSVLYQGGLPVFADVEPDTLNLSPEQVRQSLTPRTRAILPIDYAGHPAALDELLAIAAERRLVVIEDASHALGARYRTRSVGSISHMTTFSLHPVKHLTTGEGGIITTDDAELARRLRQFRSHGIESDARRRQERGEWHYEMTALGYNYRLTDIGCALGMSQLPRLAQNISRRQQIAALYAEGLAAVDAIALPAVTGDVSPAWHLYPIRVRGGSERRDTAFRALRAEGIGVNVHYMPVHLHPYYRTRFGHAAGLTPIAEQAATELLSLPMFHGMSDADVDDTIRAVKKVMAR